MATTENNYTGDGVTTNYPFTFEYIGAQDVKVQLDGTDTTEYTLANATTVSLNTAPAVGVAIRVYRETGTDSMPATFFAGSTIQATDLNDNFNVALFVSQEAQQSASDAADSLPVATAAQATADGAVATADAAAASAQTANNAALSATTTANEASTTATNAETTANTAVAAANSAVSTANAAAALVASANLPALVPNVADIPGSPSDNDLVEVADSTGIESFTPLTGLPVGFVGETGLAVKLVYSATGTTWSYLEYSPTDPDARYATEAEATTIATNAVGTLPTDVATAQSTADGAVATANGALQRSGGTMTGTITFAAGQTFGITTGDASTSGIVMLDDAVNSTSDESGGTAATPSAVKSAYDRATTAINTANNATASAATANTAATDANSAASAAQSAADAAQVTANSAVADAAAAQSTADSKTNGPDYELDTNINTASGTDTIADLGGSFGQWDKCEVIFKNVNLSGGNNVIIQVGDQTTWKTESYQSASSSQSDTATASDGFVIDRASDTSDTSGLMTLHYLSGGEIVESHAAGDTVNGWSGGGFQGSLGELGYISRLRIKAGGSNNFTKGRVVVRIWKY